jgi:hypothetical protein
VTLRAGWTVLDRLHAAEHTLPIIFGYDNTAGTLIWRELVARLAGRIEVVKLNTNACSVWCEDHPPRCVQKVYNAELLRLSNRIQNSLNLLEV